MERTVEVIAIEGDRLDRLVSEGSELSRTEVQRLIRSGAVTVNGELSKPSYRAQAGDRIVLALPQSDPLDIRPWDFALSVVYEDADCIVIDKPAGLVVHPATSHQHDTLVNALIFRYPDIAAMLDVSTEQGRRPGIVHRLDKDTSGLMVVARNRAAVLNLQKQFKEQGVVKVYQALVHDRLQPSGTIDAPIRRDPKQRKRMAVVADGRPAVTEYAAQQYLAARFGGAQSFTLADVRLHTGRTHQIRVHMAHIGHPVVGDTVYGRRREHLVCPRQFLHAQQLGFQRPSDAQWISLNVPMPEDLREVLGNLQPLE